MTTVLLKPNAIKLIVETNAALSPALNPYALILETGVGVRGANSYVTVDYARSYFIGRRLHSNAWTTSSRDTQAIALKQASALLDYEFVFSGSGPLVANQGLLWPQVNAIDKANNPVTGIPKAIKDAVCELALYLLQDDRMVSRDGAGLTSLRVDVISLVFDKTDGPITIPSYIVRMLTGLASPVRGSGQIKTVRLVRT